MAIKALVCPQCGANLELDDSRDFGFCQFCGAKVMLHETIEVKHTGSVKIDNSDQARNMMNLANNAFNARNFPEAYTYFSKTLECDSMNAMALFLKGVCAVYVSDPLSIRTNEYVQATAQAKNIALSPNSNFDAGVLLHEVERVSSEMLESMFASGKPTQPKSQEQGACISEFTKATGIVELARSAVDLMESEPCIESQVNSALAFIDETLKTKLKYIAGEQTDKKGRTTPIIKTITVSSDQKKKLVELKAELCGIFNNLPSKLAMSGDINNRLDDASEEVSRVKAILKEKKSERMSKFLASLKDRKNQELKNEIAALDAEIKQIESQFKDVKSVEKGISGELKSFNKTLK